MFELTENLANRGAELVIISDNDEILKKAALPIKMPENIDEDMTPFSYIIPWQLFAYRLALAHGFDPDSPNGLTKITLTR